MSNQDFESVDFLALIQNIDEGVMVLGKNWKYIFVNRKTDEIPR